MKRIATALMWSVVLAMGGWLAGCASDTPDVATATEKSVTLEIAPQYDIVPAKAETTNHIIKFPACVQETNLIETLGSDNGRMYGDTQITCYRSLTQAQLTTLLSAFKLPPCVKETKLIEALVLVNGVMNRGKQRPCYKSLTPVQGTILSNAVKKVRVVNVLRKKQHETPLHICFSRSLDQQNNIWSVVSFTDNLGRCADSNNYVLTEPMFWRAVNAMEQAGIIMALRRENDRINSVEILKPKFGSPEQFILNDKELLRLNFPLFKIGKLYEESLSTSRLPYRDRYCTNPNTFYARQLKPAGKVGRLFLGNPKRGKAVGHFSACVTQWEWEATIHYPRLINLKTGG